MLNFMFNYIIWAPFDALFINNCKFIYYSSALNSPTIVSPLFILNLLMPPPGSIFAKSPSSFPLQLPLDPMDAHAKKEDVLLKDRLYFYIQFLHFSIFCVILWALRKVTPEDHPVVYHHQELGSQMRLHVIEDPLKMKEKASFKIDLGNSLFSKKLHGLR